MKGIIVALFLLFITINARSEYRVYQYYVKAQNPFSVDQKAHLVTSTLDPTSYLAYHGGSETLKVDMLRSWMCLGDTSQHKDLCSPPIALGNTSEATE
jgi:hypothetical protein